MNCNNCVFAIREAQVQTGCYIRKDKVKREDINTDEGYWDLYGLCQYRRDKDLWAHRNKSIIDMIDMAKEESKITFSIATRTESDLDILREMNYGITKNVIYYDPQMYMAQTEKLTLSEDEHVSFNLDQDTDWRIIFGRQVKTTFFGCFESCKGLPLNFFSWLNREINDSGFRFSVASQDENILMSKMVFNAEQIPIDDIIYNAKYYNRYYDLAELIDLCKQDFQFNAETKTWQ